MVPFIERGLGCQVWDIDGNEYVEFGSGRRANLLGHGHEPALRAARTAMGLGLGFVRPHRIEREAAERLIDLIPGAEMVKFGINAPDATTAAARLARAYTGRDMVAVCRDHSFFPPTTGTPAPPPWRPGSRTRSGGSPSGFPITISMTSRVLAAHPARIAAVILEPETGQPPEPGYFAGLRELCDTHGVLLIPDETITGFRWHVAVPGSCAA